jgi:hypothetical protein
VVLRRRRFHDEVGALGPCSVRIVIDREARAGGGDEERGSPGEAPIGARESHLRQHAPPIDPVPSDGVRIVPEHGGGGREMGE